MGGVYNMVNMHLYHYAGNNPLKYTDPDGKTATYSINENTKTSYINLNIVIYGKNANQHVANGYMARIREQWGQDNNGNVWKMKINGKDYNVNFNVNVTVGKRPNIFTKLWNAFFGTKNYIEVDNNFPRPEVVNGYLGTWIGSSTPQRYGYPFTLDNIPAHEAGHLLGFKDRYSDNENNFSVPHPGWENNIMATTFGRVEQKNIDVLGDFISGRRGSGTLRSKYMRY
jgi:hypothetical protein